MRGFDLIAAVAVVAETGDLSRFQNPRELMGYLGLVPSESSTGNKANRGGITKAGNGRARHMLVEAAWSYRYPPRVSRDKQPKVAAAPRRVREIAWNAQTRVCGRFRLLVRKGKRPTIVATAVARELSAFIWAIPFSPARRTKSLLWSVQRQPDRPNKSDKCTLAWRHHIGERRHKNQALADEPQYRFGAPGRSLDTG
jgi:hypothetical protein